MGRTRLSSRKLFFVAVIVIITIIAALVYVAIRPSEPPQGTTAFRTVTFDFDTGSPLLTATQGTPFNQTLNGLTASFSSPSDSNAFSVKDLGIESLRLSKFSGKYLYDNKPSRDILDIKFSENVIDARLTFATIENKSGVITVPSNILITGYRNTNLVGSNQTVGTFSSDSYPQGTLYFYAGLPFNWIRISIPSQTSETTDFLVDNIIVSVVSKP